MFGTRLEDILTENEMQEYAAYRDVCRIQVDDFPYEEEQEIAVAVGQRNPYDGRMYE